MHAGLVLSAHAHNIEYYGLVKVVNNASGTRLAGRLECKSPIELECKIPISTYSLDLVQRELVVFLLISPRALYIIQPRACRVYKLLIQPCKQQQKQIYRLRNVRAGYVLYRALVVIVIVAQKSPYLEV